VALLFNPLCGGEARSTGPIGGSAWMPIPFRQCMDALSKSPALCPLGYSAHGLGGRSPASAKWGGLLFGYFLLATQEKVARPPQEDESSASKHQQRKATATPRLNPVPIKPAKKKHRASRQPSNLLQPAASADFPIAFSRLFAARRSIRAALRIFRS